MTSSFCFIFKDTVSHSYCSHILLANIAEEDLYHNRVVNLKGLAKNHGKPHKPPSVILALGVELGYDHMGMVPYLASSLSFSTK